MIYVRERAQPNGTGTGRAAKLNSIVAPAAGFVAGFPPLAFKSFVCGGSGKNSG